MKANDWNTLKENTTVKEIEVHPCTGDPRLIFRVDFTKLRNYGSDEKPDYRFVIMADQFDKLRRAMDIVDGTAEREKQQAKAKTEAEILAEFKRDLEEEER